MLQLGHEFSKEMITVVINDDLTLNYISIMTELTESQYLRLPERLTSATEKRKKDFLLGRLCAEMNSPKVESDNRGRPVWPNGFKGSISHSKDFAASLVTQSSQIKSIGLDIERVVTKEKLAVIEKTVLSDSESQFINSLSSQDKLKYATIMFSAKESLFKMINPLSNCYIKFHEGEVLNIDLIKMSYIIRLKSSDIELENYLGDYEGRIIRIENNWLTYSLT